MDWTKFKPKFHRTWHKDMQAFITSNQCNKIYAFLKNRKGKEIFPKSQHTFKPFEQPLNEVKVVVMFNEPYYLKYREIPYADGVPLSSEYTEKMPTLLHNFYNALEEELYGLQLRMIKHESLDYLRKQGVLLLHDTLTVEYDDPGSHKGLWDNFTKYVLVKCIIPRNIPIIFCGTEVTEKYRHLLPPLYPYMMTPHRIEDSSELVPWNTNGVFTKVNKYLYDNTMLNEISWLDLVDPF